MAVRRHANEVAGDDRVSRTRAAKQETSGDHVAFRGVAVAVAIGPNDVASAREIEIDEIILSIEGDLAGGVGPADRWRAINQFELDEPWCGFVSSDEQSLLVPGWPNRLRTLRLQDGAVVKEENGCAGGVRSVRFCPTGKYFATCADALRVWDAASGRLQFSFCSPAGVWEAAWSSTEDSIATAHDDGAVRIWDLRLGKPFVYLQPKTRPTKPLQGFAYHPDGKHVQAVYPGLLVTWDLHSGRSVAEVQRDDLHNAFPPGWRHRSTDVASSQVTHSADGRRFAKLISGGAGGIAVCDALTGEEVLRLESQPGAQHVLFASDGMSLISYAASGGGLYYWPGQR